jgi:NAD(P)-dependent dehydrogenase (short-subunit alcohol dehydrogenase family)
MKLDSGTRIVVTGASRGIGAAVAGAFEARGCEVGRVSRSGEISANVADPESIEDALEGFGPIDVLVANAGIAHYLPFAEMPRMPSWYRLERSVDPEPLAEAVVKAVEDDAREVFYPRSVRMLRILHGLHPPFADALLRRRMGRSAAP